MVVWTEERWRSHTPPRLERRRAAHRRRRGRGHKPGCWGLHTPRRLERRGAAHQLAGRVQTNNPVWGGSLAVLGLAGKGRLASFSRHTHCMAGPPLEAERPLWRQLAWPGLEMLDMGYARVCWCCSETFCFAGPRFSAFGTFLPQAWGFYVGLCGCFRGALLCVFMWVPLSGEAKVREQAL